MYPLEGDITGTFETVGVIIPADIYGSPVFNTFFLGDEKRIFPETVGEIKCGFNRK